MSLVRCTGDFERAMQYMEVPDIDAIQHQIWTDTISDFPRLASSAAHIYGHPRAFTESFAAMQPAPDITMARYILNEQMVRGINLIETMMYGATPPPGLPPSPLGLRGRTRRQRPLRLRMLPRHRRVRAGAHRS